MKILRKSKTKKDKKEKSLKLKINIDKKKLIPNKTKEEKLDDIDENEIEEFKNLIRYIRNIQF